MGKLSQSVMTLLVASLAMASAGAVAQANLGMVNVGSGASSTVTVTVPSAAMLGSVVVVTQGATGLDFANAGTGSCAVGTSYTAGQTCTVKVNFKPAYAGERYGAVLLKDASGAVIATAYVQGNGVGPQIAYDPGTAIAIAPIVDGVSIFQPSGVAVDGAGNLFIADDANDRVVEVPAGGGAATAFDPIVNGSGLRIPRGVAIDGAGNLYISDLESNRIMEVPAGGGAATATDPMPNGEGLHYPCGLVIDGVGNLFIADVDDARLVEIPVGGGAAIATDPTVAGVGLSYPVNLALDSAGDLFISDLFGNRVVEAPAGGGAAIGINPTVDGKSLNQPYGVAVDAAGDLFIADSGNNRLILVPAGGGAATAINPTVNGKGLNDPIGIVLDGAGDLFISDYNNNRVVELQRSQAPVLSFAGTAVGTTSSDSPQTVQVRNIGNGPLSFPAPTVGTNPSISANFVLRSNGASDCPLVAAGASSAGTLAAGASCLLPISFEPNAAGPLSGVLTLTDNHLNAAGPGFATQTLSLIGDAPLAALSAGTLSFGPQALGTTSAAQQVTLTNTGGAAMAIASIAVTGAGASSFSFQNSCGSTLAAGASCTIQGQFTPGAGGALTATVTITDNAVGATGSQQTVSVTGAGIYPTTVTVTPSASSITTAQSLSVAVAVKSGSNNPAPTGTVTLTVGSYVSGGATLASGAVTINVPAGSLSVGTDSILAAYMPDSAGSNLYAAGSGSSSVTVTGAPTISAPVITTGTASAVTTNSATLAGTVNPDNADTHYWFLYGVNSDLSGASQTAAQDAGSGNAGSPVSVSLTGLNPSTLYYYQAVAQNSAGTTSGAIKSFATAGVPYFSLAAAAFSVTPGATTGNTTTVTIVPWNGFTGTVALTCQISTTLATYNDLPTCSIQPGSVPVTGTGSPQATLSISTTAPVALNQPARPFWLSAGGAVMACVLLFGFPRRRQRWKTTLGLLVLCVAIAVGGCGAGTSNSGGGDGVPTNPGTTPGTYTVTLSGASGGSTTTATDTLTVQ